MLTYIQAKNVGRAKCFDLLGYEFCMRNKDNALASYSMDEEADDVSFFIGIDTNPDPMDERRIVLDHKEFPFFSHVVVNRLSGEVEVLDKRVPV